MPQLKTAIALIIFNRPDTTEKVFEAIRQAKPSKLLVVADGPRANRPGEAEKCAATRAIINRVDWECEVLRNFSDVNLGCQKRVVSGLDWVFSEVEEAIILEDDCLPTPSFFHFCQTLLEYYRHDERIMHIGGNNFQPSSRTNYSYYFSKYNHCWGWASWRRAWKYYDVDMKTLQEYKKLGLINSICENVYEETYWIDKFDEALSNLISAWDYQWTYTCWSQNGLSITPNTNLISNIGFGSEATHTRGDSPLANLPTTDIWEVKHPPFMVKNRRNDIYTFENVFGGKYLKGRTPFLTRIRGILLPIKRKLKLINLKHNY